MVDIPIFHHSINKLILEYCFDTLKKMFKHKMCYKSSSVNFRWLEVICNGNVESNGEMYILVLKNAAKYNNVNIIRVYYYENLLPDNHCVNKMFDIAWRYSSADVVLYLLKIQSDRLNIRHFGQSSYYNVSELFIQACKEGKFKLAKLMNGVYDIFGYDPIGQSARRYKLGTYEQYLQALHCVIQKGNIDATKWIVSLFNHVGIGQTTLINLIFKTASINGYVHILDWLIIEFKITDKYLDDLCSMTLEDIPNCHEQVKQWLLTHRKPKKQNCITQ